MRLGVVWCVGDSATHDALGTFRIRPEGDGARHQETYRDKQDDMSLGELEQMILLAVLQAGEDAFGGSVAREVADRTGRRIARGALYVTLDRLEAKGLVRSTLGESTPGRGGRRKRMIEVTEAGLVEIRRARGNWIRMWSGIEDILERP